MEIKDKILEILIFRVFGSDLSKGLLLDRPFSCDLIDEDNKSCCIGIANISWYNLDVWGSSRGKLIKNGRLTYKDADEQFCYDWVESFLSDISVLLFSPGSKPNYANVYNYLRVLYKKMITADELNRKFEKEKPELFSLCNIYFEVCGNVGEETVGVSQASSKSPLYLLEDFEWIETKKIPVNFCGDTGGGVDMDSFYEFIQGLEDNKDKILLAKLFIDYTGQNAVMSKKITKLDNGAFEVSLNNWDLWKNRDIEWLEQIGEKKTGGFFVTYNNLVITGTYDEIETMLCLVKGEKQE